MSEFEYLRAAVQAAKYLKSKGIGGRSLKNLLFPRQAAFIADKAKRKAALCSRRAGKSTGCAISLADDLMSPLPGDCAYITLTRGTAKKILFNPLQKMNKDYSLGLEVNRTDLMFSNPETGSSLYLTGASTEDEVEKLRGLKLRKVIIDEAASFRPHIINYLIDEIIEPTLIDMDGDLTLIGTPSANPGENFFHRITTGLESGWSVHKWTILDNPFIPHAESWLEQYRTRKGWDDQHPIYLREWKGEWTSDPDSLVYRYSASRQHFGSLPSSKWNYVIGVDLGFNDAFAICVLAFSYDRRDVYVVHEIKRTELIPSKMAEILLELRDKFQPMKMVADQGGLGKAIVEEFNQRYQLNIHPAEKTKKAAYIEIMNGDLISGALRIKDDSLLAKEMKVHQWNPDKPDKEDDRTPNDLCDAALYGFRECKHFMGEVPMELPEAHTPAFYQMEADRMIEKDLEAFEKDQAMEWWENV